MKNVTTASSPKEKLLTLLRKDIWPSREKLLKEKLLTLLKEYLEKDEIIEDSIYGLFVYHRQEKELAENRKGILVITSKRVLFFSVSSSGKGYLQEIPYEKINHISYKRELLANSLEIILGRDREINQDSHQLLQKGLEITLEPERVAITGKFSEAFAKKLSEKVGSELRIVDRRRQERNSALIALIVLIVAPSIAFFWSYYNVIVSPSHKKTSSKADVPSDIDVCVTAHLYVKQLLKAPSTAKFPPCDFGKVSRLGNKQYRYQSYVDAQNSFGAMVRTYYVVEMEYLGNDEWKLKDIKWEY